MNPVTPAGLGTRKHLDDPFWGPVEVLDLRPELTTLGAERAIRMAVTALRDSGAVRDGGPVAPTHDVRRVGNVLAVMSADCGGVKLSDLLDALQVGALALSESAVFDLAAAVVRAVAWLHERPGGRAHGALTPAHIVLGKDGGVMLTDAVYAEALRGLEWNRDTCWRELGLALPPSASLPRFDQRADVVQLGTVVLAVLLRRRLTVEDYPAGLHDLVMAATSGPPGVAAAPIRAWLQEALHLHPRSTFGSGIEAARAFPSGPAVEAARLSARSRTALRTMLASLA